MGRRFNVDGICYPEEHYMVDMEDRLEEIKKLIDDGNRVVQRGSTSCCKNAFGRTKYII